MSIKGILGRKVGMTQLFDEEGKVVPVTVLAVEPNVVTQVRTVETDGYSAAQVAFGECRVDRLTRPEQGHLRAAGVLQEVEQGGSTDMLGHSNKTHHRLAQQHWQQPVPHRRRPAPNHRQPERHIKCGMGPRFPDHSATFTDRYKTQLFCRELA